MKDRARRGESDFALPIGIQTGLDSLAQDVSAMLIRAMKRRVAPSRVYTSLMRWARRRCLTGVHPLPRKARHTYGGFPLEILLNDELGARWYDHDLPELPEIALLKQHQLQPGACVFNLGAHQGVVALMLANAVGPRGKVVAVEAIPYNVRIAEVNRALNHAMHVKTIHVAVADRCGVLAFDEGLVGQVHDGSALRSKVEVPARTIDDLAREFGRPDVLFIDVEGYECHALRGAEQTLRSRPDCFIEVHVGTGLEKFGGSVGEILSFFPRHCYDLFQAVEEQNAGRFEAFQLESSMLKGRFYLVAIRREGG